VPIVLYNKIKFIADENYITVSGLIFNILDEVIHQSGAVNVDILEVQETDKQGVSRIVQEVLRDDE
jgi:hypothetical protein